jgi:hypothetical protein
MLRFYMSDAVRKRDFDPSVVSLIDMYNPAPQPVVTGGFQAFTLRSRNTACVALRCAAPAARAALSERPTRAATCRQLPRRMASRTNVTAGELRVRARPLYLRACVH